MATVDTAITTTDNAPVSATEATTTAKVVSEPKMNGHDVDKKEEESVPASNTTTTDKTTTITTSNSNSNSNSKSDDDQNKPQTDKEKEQKKEQEQPTSAPAPKQTEEELLSAGTKLITQEKYSEAADILSNAMNLIQQKNIANTIESVKYYMAYGEALLRLVQSSNDLFGAPVHESRQQHLAERAEEEDDDVDIAEPQLITDATDKSEESKTENPENSGNSKEEQDDEDEDVDLKQAPSSNSKEEAEDEPEQAAPAPAPQGDVDTADDREYAWESFEYARGIIEEYLSKEENRNKDNDEYYKILTSAHVFLGELLLEDEVYEAALTEFNKALEIQKECKNKDIIKVRSKASNYFMASLAAQFAEKDDEAVKHCDAALQELSERISKLLTQFGCTECVEMKENDYEQIQKVAKDFMGDDNKFNEENKQSEDGKEMKDLVEVMGDLHAKLEELKEIIQLKKEGKYGNTAQPEANGAASAMGAFDQQLAMDPLQALISGLTSKFGIDEQQLAAMAAEEEGEDENKNTSNKNISAPSGVTTIGFGNANAVKDDDEEINEIVCVKRKKKDTDKESNNDNMNVEKKEEKKTLSGKKRKMEDADIDDGMDEVNGAAKKMKLNDGNAAVANNTNDNNNDNQDGK